LLVTTEAAARIGAIRLTGEMWWNDPDDKRIVREFQILGTASSSEDHRRAVTRSKWVLRGFAGRLVK